MKQYLYVIIQKHKDFPLVVCMNETFINKYKPYYLEETFFNPSIIDTIHSLIELNDMNMLFVGPATCGKTTLIECIIRHYYGLDKKNSLTKNVLYITNLKEQGIHFYRNEMKTFCQSHSSIVKKKKLVIIDDMDSINEQSQHVFRSYIDYYSKNVNFICSCSNSNKIIESLQSRFCIIKLDLPTNTKINEIVNSISSKENIAINKNAQKYLIDNCDKNVRYVMNILEKMYILTQDDKPVTLDQCKTMCLTISAKHFDEYIGHLKRNDLMAAIRILYELNEYGYSVIDILESFFSYLKVTPNLCEDEIYKCFPVICEYIVIFNKLHENSIELSLFTAELMKALIK